MPEESRSTEEPVNPSLLAQVVPGLWIGPLASVTEIRKLSQYQWTIISLLSSPKLKDFIERCLQEAHGLLTVDHHELWELKDQSQAALISSRLEQVLGLMDASLGQTGGSADCRPKVCLVHCAFGISRSASLCAAWLLSRRTCTTVADALDTVRRARPECSPNMGFLAGLRALEQTDGNVQAAIERMKRHNSTGASTSSGPSTAINQQDTPNWAT